MIQFPFETGNSIEISIAPLLRKHFPLYERFRSDFLVPMTGFPKNKNWRRDTHPDLERIGLASFGLLKSLNFINIKKDLINVSGHPDQNFKNIYFHFGLATDCIDAMFRSIIVIKSYLKIINLEKKLKISDKELLAKFKVWLSTKYPKQFEELVHEGKPIFYYPQSDHSYITLILTNKRKRSAYLEVVRELKDYRNFFIHNPGVDVFRDNIHNKLNAIKKSEVKKTRNWASLSYLYSLDSTLFVDPKNMVHDDLIRFTHNLNIIWPSVIDNLNTIYNHPSFPMIFRKFNRKDL